MITVKNVNKLAMVATSALLFSGLALAQVAFSVVKVPNSSSNSYTAVNNSGEVLVNTGTPSSYQVSLWSRATGAQAIALVGSNSGGADINNSNQVAGSGDPDNSGNPQAFLWQQSTGEQWLGALGGNLSEAGGINDSGAVVGMAFNGLSQQHAFLWTQGSGMQDLTPALTSSGGSTAVAINSSNEVVGYYFPNGSNNSIGFTWTQDGGLQNLGPAGTIAQGVNDAGTVVGQWPAGNGYKHAFSWTSSGGFLDLGTLGGSSSALSINNQGWIVGTSLATTGKGILHGFLWTPAAGMQDFTTLAGLITGEQVSSAQVNDLGVIAIATNKGGYLLLPKVLGTFTSSANPSVFGQPVTFTANLSSVTGPPPDGESVTFSVSGKVVGSAPLSGGVAQFTISSITVGGHAVVVNYPGDASHIAVKYAALNQKVIK
jgi:probable HAF family extracellular repeat protein